MRPALEQCPLPDRLHRVHRATQHGSDFPDQRWLDRPAFHRFDDPDRRVRVFYAALHPEGAFLEVLDALRPSPLLPPARAATGGIARPPRLLHWASERRFSLVEAHSPRPLLDLTSASTLSALTLHLPAHAPTDRPGFDLSDITSKARRPLTQAIAGFALENDYAGVRYLSRHGSNQHCVAVFERPDLELALLRTSAITRTTPGLVVALAAFGLELGGTGQ